MESKTQSSSAGLASTTGLPSPLRLGVAGGEAGASSQASSTGKRGHKHEHEEDEEDEIDEDVYRWPEVRYVIRSLDI